MFLFSQLFKVPCFVFLYAFGLGYNYLVISLISFFCLQSMSRVTDPVDGGDLGWRSSVSLVMVGVLLSA